MSYTFPVDGGISFTLGDLVDLLFDDDSLRTLAELTAAAVRNIDERTGAERPGERNN